ncbi:MULTISPECIES: hypothetical protein [Myxococcus]|uniref:hypothetical protein n=1 Tax=Myxococcus TaxID=32 RepID=UPI001FECF935|nr:MULTISPECIES: hypothetical protein [Myxococcus]
MGSAKAKGERRTRGDTQRQTPRKRLKRQPLEHAAGFARDRVIERLDVQRGDLAQALEDAARGLEQATRRTPSPLSQHMLETGERVLRGASSRLDQHSVGELMEHAGRQVRQRPGWLISGLLGVGLIAGRVFRASGVTDTEGRAET